MKEGKDIAGGGLHVASARDAGVQSNALVRAAITLCVVGWAAEVSEDAVAAGSSDAARGARPSGRMVAGAAPVSASDGPSACPRANGIASGTQAAPLGRNERASAEKPSLPAVRVLRVRRVFHNGEHNAFTDLCRFKDRFYSTFRSCPDEHDVRPSSSIIVLTNKDAERWEQVCRFSIPKPDTRDPHFFIFRGRLFVYTGTWYCGDRSPARDGELDLNCHLGYAVWSDAGRRWHGPQMLEVTYGHYV